LHPPVLAENVPAGPRVADRAAAAADGDGTPDRIAHEAADSDFSMILGGPLYQLLRRAHLLREPLELLRRRIIVISLLGWLPLLIAAIAVGRTWGGSGVKVPFLFDIATHVRFLIALPLLILAEWVVHMRFRPLIGQFTARDLIKPKDRLRFGEIVQSSMRMRNSVAAEVILLIIVVTGGHLLWRHEGSLQISTWYADAAAAGDGLHLTLAGRCYAYWSQPLFQFILLRWYFRIFIWTRFLWRVSRLDLNLIPTHPDRAGGLGFLTGTAHAMMPLLIAQSAVISGVMANRIFFQGAKLMQFRLEILFLVLFLVALALGPLMLFAPRLLACQRLGRREYGLLASRYVAAFDDKWLRNARDGQTELLGSADIQSLADLGNSFAVVDSMNPFPFGKAAAIRVALMTALPLLPLVLTVIPFNELIDRLFRSLL
jgi:hypothetical protein